jgi:phytol kinase
MKETLRQIVHLIFGLGIAGLIMLFEEEITTAVLALSIFLGLIISDAVMRGYQVPLFSPIIDFLERQDALPGKGALFFAISSLFCLIIFKPAFVIVAIIVLALLDSTSTIIGLRFGRIRIYNKKSVEGSLVGSLVAFGAILFLLPFSTALPVAVTAGLVELFSPIDDNLLIPVSVCLILVLIG